MSTTTGGDLSNTPQCGSQASQVQLDSIPISGSPQLESTNDSQPIEIDDDDEEEEDVMAGSKRKLKSAVWKEFTKVKISLMTMQNVSTARRNFLGCQEMGLTTFVAI
jgi:hypothetical protein